MRKLYEKGQAIVLVLLSLSVILTVVLFSVSRSVSDISTSTSQSDSVRAFSAAEAGVEQALLTGANVAQNIGDASFITEVSSEGSDKYNHDPSLLSGESMTLWFVSHDEDGKINCTTKLCYSGPSFYIYWGDPGTSNTSTTTPAVEITIYYASTPAEVFQSNPDFKSVKTARVTFDPNIERTNSNKFWQALTGNFSAPGKEYGFMAQVNFSGISSSINTSGLLFAKIRMLYNEANSPQPIGFYVLPEWGVLPSQGLEIVSTGTFNFSNRKVYMFRSWSEFPFSGFSLYYPSGVVTQE